MEEGILETSPENEEAAVSEYHFAVGPVTAWSELLPEIEKLNRYNRFCTEIFRYIKNQTHT